MTSIPIDLATISIAQAQDGKYCYSVTSLIQQVEEQKLESFDYPVAAFNMRSFPWNDITTYRDFLSHCKRVRDTDLSYPLILHCDGWIMDGAHRMCKAILEGKETIKAVRFIKEPKYTSIEEE